MIISFLLMSPAFAEYPSPTPKGALTVYQSLGFSQWSKYRVRGDSDSIPNPVQRAISQTSLGYGVSQNLDIQLTLPVLHSMFGDSEPVSGVGFAELSSKIMLLQEGTSPITLSFKPAIRIGSFHASSRGKFHNIGEGTIDLGAGIALGRFEYLDMGFYWFDAGIRYWYRIPSSFDLSVPPAPDVTFDLNVGYSFHPSFGLGITAEGIQRLGGQDYPTTTVDDDDQWAALQITQLKAGGRLSYYATEKITIDLIGLVSVFAINNPTDEVYVGLGLNYFQPPRR